MRAAASFSFPTATLFGPGTLGELPRRLGEIHSRRPLVVTDPGLLPTRAFESLRGALGKNQLGETWELFHGVHANPTEQDVIDAANAYRQGRCDAVIAFGGGSALDVAKALRLLVKKPDLKLARFNFDDDWSGLPRCIAIPTTAGTGSEVGRSSVITMAGAHRRSVIFHPKLLAKLVILDPEVTRDLPPQLTAATGLDALTHCIESFTSPVVHPLCDGIALEGIHLIVGALPVAFQEGGNLEARGKMLLAATMGGVAFQKDLGATHSMAHPLSALCGLHHGTANALCLPHVMAFNAQRKPGLYRRVGISCGLETGKLPATDADRVTIEFVRKFIADLGLGGGLRAQGVKDSQLDGLVAQAFEDSCHATNPVPLKFDDFRALYVAAM